MNELIKLYKQLIQICVRILNGAFISTEGWRDFKLQKVIWTKNVSNFSLQLL